ncbi:Hypothetical protein FKW44_003408, partial [Caligus rogercresseyi]
LPFLQSFHVKKNLKTTAMLQNILTLHDLKRNFIFNTGKFLFPLKRSTFHYPRSLTPWSFKLTAKTNKSSDVRV